MEKQEFGNVEMEWCVADLLQWNLLQKSLLEISSLAMNNQAPFFDIMLEKGCADAISCGEHVVVDLEGSLVSLEPVAALMANLARIMRIGGTLLSLSYSKYRYDFLKPDSETFIESLAKLWRVVECKNMKPEAEQSSQAEERTHVVYEPEVFHTIFVLERIGL
ncbi:hypothetical protein BCR33DRAFT_712416 [Rhizoclosmatium globosum]|uniref:Methyltransferase type 11 domain-containing protein n=1 Tax=Rhizoclosmatium globosum TaxID=329046 RepID=A0A1Y2CWB3_9FUNG|nr:hypothetical protein BCR33DRAFT_712416 [Rhizoclosmatium globosum]|eukprot:ORY51329.1 hypothetical protein BCR33DRAFT_712416 [Rhizoclosmatium globosum]